MCDRIHYTVLTRGRFLGDCIHVLKGRSGYEFQEKLTILVSCLNTLHLDFLDIWSVCASELHENRNGITINKCKSTNYVAFYTQNTWRKVSKILGSKKMTLFERNFMVLFISIETDAWYDIQSSVPESMPTMLSV